MNKKVIATIILVLMIFTSVYAEECIWIDEKWIKIDREIECGDFSISIHAQVLVIPDDIEACEYHIEKLNSDFMVEKGAGIHWGNLDCDTRDVNWHMPEDGWEECGFFSTSSLYPACSILPICKFHLDNVDPEKYRKGLTTYSNEIEKIDISGLPEEQIRIDAENVATELGYQLGGLLRVSKCDDINNIFNELHTSPQMDNNIESLPVENGDGCEFKDFIYPVYYNGLRLYSGDWISTENLLEIPNMNLRIRITPEYGISQIESVLIDTKSIKSATELHKVMSFEDALRCIEEKYTNMYIPGLERIVIHRLSLEYVPITGDLASEKGFLLYPAWVVQTSQEFNYISRPYNMYSYEAYDAITGRPLF